MINSHPESKDLAAIRDLFPITRRSVYFNHAGTGPVSIPARQAMEKYIALFAQQAEMPAREYFDKIKQWRTTIARVIKTSAENITFVHNTSEALYIALMNIPFEPGDKILVMEEAFPAIRYIVNNNLPHVDKVFVPFLKRDALETIKKHYDKRVKAVVIEHAHYLTGEMFDLDPASEFLRQEGIFLVVDGIQTVGAIDLDMSRTRVDFLACGCGKWLFGPSGIGFLYIDKKCLGSLKRTHIGWLGAQWKGFEDCKISPALYPDARMFELGSRNIIGISALVANIRILLEYGMKNVENNILALKETMRERFLALGYDILTPQKHVQSGILTVRPPGDVQAIYRSLNEANIIVSLRSNALRFSPHFYNTPGEVDKIFSILKKQ
jgi:cysteine desulfurase/selenocysteine lyase